MPSQVELSSFCSFGLPLLLPMLPSSLDVANRRHVRVRDCGKKHALCCHCCWCVFGAAAGEYREAALRVVVVVVAAAAAAAAVDDDRDLMDDERSQRVAPDRRVLLGARQKSTANAEDEILPVIGCAIVPSAFFSAVDRSLPYTILPGKRRQQHAAPRPT